MAVNDLERIKRTLIEQWGSDEEGADELLASLKAVGLAVTDDPCICKLAPGEPFFVLRGHDITAAERVTDWANNVESIYQRGRHPISEATADKLAGARRCADAMRAWSDQKLPD